VFFINFYENGVSIGMKKVVVEWKTSLFQWIYWIWFVPL
jgi:hypothetical protein